MRHQLILIDTSDIDSLIIEPSFTDPMAHNTFAFVADLVDNPMDADDPEAALKDYYDKVGAR